MKLKKLTPVLFVEAIEPCLPFWVDRLGFEKTVEVPHGDRLGFVILVRDDVEVMLQTRASVAEDVPALSGETSRSFLYIEVADLAPIVERLKGADIVIPVRTTPYGATEIGARDPAGNVILFAHFAAAA
ncbi:MAG: VOC family protein [Acidobacteria bacterium]|nr:VOC family protein [Acidobacteriota bacterium]